MGMGSGWEVFMRFYGISWDCLMKFKGMFMGKPWDVLTEYTTYNQLKMIWGV
jgi:hypothetical protein